MIEPKVSIIIPVYNVELYIERCLHSLFKQTLDNIEYIFIDDGSTDLSIPILREVLKSYPERKNQVKIISHNVNKGVASARITGIKATTGVYIIHCDPDDTIELTMMESLYKKAILTDADITICNIDINYNNKIIPIYLNFKGTPDEYLHHNIFNPFVYASLVNKLIKRNLIIDNSIYPFEGCNYGEDLGCMIRILYFAKSITFVNEILYHYIRRTDSISGNSYANENFREIIKLISHIDLFFKDKPEYKILCNYLKFFHKINYRHLFKGNELQWYELFSECHKDIFKYKCEPLKTRLFWWLVFKNYFFYKILSNIHHL